MSVFRYRQILFKVICNTAQVSHDLVMLLLIMSVKKDKYQFVTQGLDAGDVGDLLASHHGVHVLHLAGQAGHCHRVEVGVPDP